MSILEAVLQTLQGLRFDNCITPVNNPDAEYETLEISEKLRVFHTLPALASTIGHAELREKLIPILLDVVSNAIDAGDDEVLMVIAQKMCKFTDYVGGQEHVPCLLPILEKIVYTVEEIVVVEAAFDSLVKIVPKLPRSAIDSTCASMIRHIIEEDLHCASKKLVSRLIIACYPLVTPKNQVDFKYRLFHLADSEDEVPLVRSEAVKQLVPLAKLFGPELKSELILLLTSLVSDNQRIVRASCVPVLIELGRMITDANEFESSVRPCIDRLAEDSSRDVKRALASSATELQTVVCAHSGSSRSLHQMMLNLLDDNDVETRSLACGQLKDFCLASPKDILVTVLLPRIRDYLSIEREERVRSELLRCAVGLLSSISREDTLPLVQFILAFLNDTSSQSKQYVFEHFAELIPLIPVNEIRLTLLPSLLRLWQDKNWRVRLGVVQSVPLVYDKLTEACLQDTVLPANLLWLHDSVWCVRECACRSLARLLVVCPNACKKAFNGLGTKATTGTTTTASTTTTTTVTTTGTTAVTATTTTGGGVQNASISGQISGSLANQIPPGGDPSGVANAANNSGLNPSVNALTSQAAAGGVKALATDSDYHLRQIYINVIQCIWGPGILKEPPYTTLGDSPSVGIYFPAIHNVQSFLQSSSTKTAKSSSSAAATTATQTSIPDGCDPPPHISNTFLSTAVAQLLRFLSEDVVPNVRICASQALQIISGSLDKKTIQNDIVPVLKKVSENDTDEDVKYFAQESLSFFQTFH